MAWQDARMAWEWVGPVATACVGIAGFGASIVISISAGRTQRAIVTSAHELESESARRAEKKDMYTRFIGATDAWNRALAPAERRIKELRKTQGDGASLEDSTSGNSIRRVRFES